MFSLSALSNFIKESGMRKIAAGLYMFSSLCILLYIGVLTVVAFVDITKLLILAVFAGNALEHIVKAKANASDKPKS